MSFANIRKGAQYALQNIESSIYSGQAAQVAEGVGKLNDAVSAVDKGGGSWGLTPGSKPPWCP